MYRAPVDDISFALKHIAGLQSALDDGHFDVLSEDLVDAIISEAGRFASEEMAPLAEAGEAGTPLVDGKVTTPPGWADLYHRWIEGGWNGLTGTRMRSTSRRYKRSSRKRPARASATRSR